MIEVVLMDYLSGALDGVPVYPEMPEDSFSHGVILEKTGGAHVGPGVYRSTFAIQCYGESMAQSAELAYQVEALMDSFAELDSIGACDLNSGPYNFPLVDAKAYRYQIVYDIIHY